MPEVPHIPWIESPFLRNELRMGCSCKQWTSEWTTDRTVLRRGFDAHVAAQQTAEPSEQKG